MSKFLKWLAYQQYQNQVKWTQEAQQQVAFARQSISEKEAYRHTMESLLGTDEQVAGRLEVTGDPLRTQQLRSPVARTVGEVLRQGREILDPDSPTSRRFFENVRDAPLRSIELQRQQARRALATEERQAIGQMQDVSRSQPAARAPFAERALVSRTREQFAQRAADVEVQAGIGAADIEARAGAMYEQFSRALATDAVGLAESWLDSTSFIRNEYVSAIANTYLAATQALTASAQTAGNAFATVASAAIQADTARKLARQKRKSTLINLALQAGLMAASAGAGAVLGPAVGLTRMQGAFVGLTGVAPGALSSGGGGGNSGGDGQSSGGGY